jgi:hypothetical protein
MNRGRATAPVSTFAIGGYYYLLNKKKALITVLSGVNLDVKQCAKG